MTWVWDHSHAKGIARMVLLALADIAGEDGVCWPAVTTIAHKCGGISERSVRRHMKDLVALGELAATTRPGSTTLYRVLTPTTRPRTDCHPSLDATPDTGDRTPRTDSHPGQSVTPDTAVTPPRTQLCPGGPDIAVSDEPPITINEPSHTPAPTARTNGDDGFDSWWSHYPRKVDKGHARKAYRSALKRATADDLLAGVQQFAETARSREPRFVPHAATWLNGDRWTDEPAAAPAAVQREPEWTW